MQTSSLLLSKDLLDEVRFDPTQKRHQDWDLLLRLYERDVTFCFVEEPLVSYNANAGMARISRDEDAMASLAWLKERQALVSASAYDAFRARRAPALARHSPGFAFGAVLEAYRRSHINSLQASRYLISSVLGLLAPGIYRRLPDMRVRGAKLAPAAKIASSVGDLPVQRHN